MVYGTIEAGIAKERCGTRNQEVSDSLHHCSAFLSPELPQEGQEALGTRMHGSVD